MSDSESEETDCVSPEPSETSSDSDTEPDDVIDDVSDAASIRSLAFKVKPGKHVATIKSKKSKKRVRFKPGDSLVLVYIIPNREMLGLKSDSEDSDENRESDDDSDDEDDDDEDDEEETDDDDDDGDEEDDDDEDDEEGTKKKVRAKKEKPFAKLIAVKQVNRRKVTDPRKNAKKVNENRKMLNFDLSALPQRPRRQNYKANKKEKKERGNKKVLQTSAVQMKQTKPKKNNTFSAIKTDLEKVSRPRRGRARLLEIRATVESSNKPIDPSAARSDFKPSVIDMNGSSKAAIKPLVNRTRLQPTSFRISKSVPRPSSGTGGKGVNRDLPEKKNTVAQVVSASYDSLTSVLPDSYVTIQSFDNGTVEEETIKRLDPDLMNAKSKRNYAWQIANGTITSQSLRTPSILPFWDSLQNSMTESNTLKLPT